jgi:DNA transformation protein
MTKNGFVEYVKDLLEPFAPVRVRAMFGGYGVYKDQYVIALIADNELYFKATPEVAEYFKSYGSEPFTYQGKTKPVAMSYWRVLPEIMDDQDELNKWFDLSVQSAVKSKKK